MIRWILICPISGPVKKQGLARIVASGPYEGMLTMEEAGSVPLPTWATVVIGEATNAEVPPQRMAGVQYPDGFEAGRFDPALCSG